VKLVKGVKRCMAVLAAAIAVVVVPVAARQQQSAAADLTARLQPIVSQWRETSGAPGVSVGIVRSDGSVVTLTAGMADRGAQRAMTPADLLMTGSTGKTFFAAVALQLIEAGKLDLAAPISRYLGSKPWFSRLPNACDITVRMLMTHTSGLVRYEMNPKFTADLRAAPDKSWTPEEELSYLFDATPPFAAGTDWDYSDTNYIVVGMICEKLTGTKLYDEVQRRFLGPLKLTHVVPSTSRRIPGLIPGYAGARDPLGLPDEVMVNGQLVINPQFEWTGGGFASTAEDLARWAKALYEAKAFGRKYLDEMLDAGPPREGRGGGGKYGLAVQIWQTDFGTSYGHGGWFPGYLSQMEYFPEHRFAVAIQFNTDAVRQLKKGPRGYVLDIARVVINEAASRKAAGH